MNNRLSAEFQLLLKVLRSETLAQEYSEAEWKTALALSEVHHVQPFLVARLLDGNYAVPTAVRATLDAIARTSAREAFWWSSELKGILSGFDARELKVLPLKGPVLAASVYGDIRRRSCRDLDLLVRPRDFEHAAHVLMELGFTSSKRADDYHQPFRRGSTTVELHFGVENPLRFNFDLTPAWSRLQTSDFAGMQVLQFAPCDEFAFLCLHAVRHRFEHLGHILDVGLFIQKFGNNSPGKLSPEMSHAIELSSVLAGILYPELTVVNAGNCEAKPHIRRLAERTWSRLENGYRLDEGWWAKHRYYLALESSLWRRTVQSIKHLWMLATRVIDADYEFAARLNITQRSLVWCVRPVRLFWKLANAKRERLNSQAPVPNQ